MSEQGLDRNRYNVQKRDGATDPRAEYFVLRLDDHGSDPEHIMACREAIVSYAIELLSRQHLMQLADELLGLYACQTCEASARDIGSPFCSGCDDSIEKIEAARKAGE